MRPRLIIFLDPGIQIGLQLVDRTVHLFAKRDTTEFIEHGLVGAFTDVVGLRALGFGPRVINILDRDVEFVSCRSGLPQNSLPRIGQYAQQFDVVALKQWQNTVVEQIRRRDRCLAI